MSTVVGREYVFTNVVGVTVKNAAGRKYVCTGGRGIAAAIAEGLEFVFITV